MTSFLEDEEPFAMQPLIYSRYERIELGQIRFQVNSR